MSESCYNKVKGKFINNQQKEKNMNITLTVPENEDNKVRTDLVQAAIDNNMKWWKDREREHSLLASELSADELKLLYHSLSSAGWAVWRDKYRDHYYPAVYISKRMPEYGIPAV